MNIVFHPSSSRGYANHGWLEARHSFSFAGFFDPQKMNFAVKWFEVDFGFYIVKILHFLRIITIK